MHVRPHGPAEIAGIPIADSLLEQLRANASIDPVLVDDDGVPVAMGKRFSALSPKIVRAVLLRDGPCRYGNACDVTWGSRSITCAQFLGWHRRRLQPRGVCRRHHRRLVPHGHRALIGNPNLPDGIDPSTSTT